MSTFWIRIFLCGPECCIWVSKYPGWMIDFWLNYVLWQEKVVYSWGELRFLIKNSVWWASWLNWRSQNDICFWGGNSLNLATSSTPVCCSDTFLFVRNNQIDFSINTFLWFYLHKISFQCVVSSMLDHVHWHFCMFKRTNQAPAISHTGNYKKKKIKKK